MSVAILGRLPPRILLLPRTRRCYGFGGVKSGLREKGNRIVALIRLRLNCQLRQIAKNRNDLKMMLDNKSTDVCFWDIRVPASTLGGNSFNRMKTPSPMMGNSYAFLQPKPVETGH